MNDVTIEFEDRWPGCLEDERTSDRWICTVTDRGLALSGVGFEQIDALMTAVRAHEMMSLPVHPSGYDAISRFFPRKCQGPKND